VDDGGVVVSELPERVEAVGLGEGDRWVEVDAVALVILRGLEEGSPAVLRQALTNGLPRPLCELLPFTRLSARRYFASRFCGRAAV